MRAARGSARWRTCESASLHRSESSSSAWPTIEADAGEQPEKRRAILICMEGARAPLLRDDLDTGFYEELDTTSMPWRGLGRFRFQSRNRRDVGGRVFTREEVDAFTEA